MFHCSESDPNQHILDTLEQCISVIIEKIQHLDQDKASSRLSSIDYARVNSESKWELLKYCKGRANMTFLLIGAVSPHLRNTTKILYFTNWSVTPFMSSIGKRIGDITLRDFKNLFDRPGFFRFHFKSVDQEFGMVKEEVRMNEDC